jgi:hypothetical protein
MIDCISSQARAVKTMFARPELVAWYGTGTPDIQWTPADIALFAGSVMVEIDQGFNSPPITTAIVRDVETGAWAVDKAVDRSTWHTPRPTIYCGRSTLPRVMGAGWRGDVWLAWPGYSSSEPPVFPGVNIVAVQNVWMANYDRSTVYDDTWPYPKQEVKDMILIDVPANEGRYLAFPPGSFKHAYIYRDFVDPHHPLKVRLAAESATRGYEIKDYTLNSSSPVVFNFAQGDVWAISIVNEDFSRNVGVTLV